ncbi:transcription termination/antitermination protein NusG [Iamia sp.]|uniref:transcription termination/antitermination protein NusG n=1 Tax=Iamia sp. TaxID=2722710 RepID=UPI0032C23548
MSFLTDPEPNPSHDTAETDAPASPVDTQSPGTVTPDAGEAEVPPSDPGEPVDAEAAVVAAPGGVDPETGEVIDVESLLEEAAPVESPFDRPGRWFVVHTQSGYEKKVKQNLEARTSSMNMEGRIHEVVIPMEDVVEIRSGKKQVVQKKMFPGYLLVRCMLDDDSWYVIRNTPGVTGFVGAGNKPSPLPRRDVETFLSVKDDSDDLPSKRGRARLEHELGETVRVKEGPFANFSGEIVEINEDQLKVKVLVDIFGRETPVELDFSQVAKF